MNLFKTSFINLFVFSISLLQASLPLKENFGKKVEIGDVESFTIQAFDLALDDLRSKVAQPTKGSAAPKPVTLEAKKFIKSRLGSLLKLKHDVSTLLRNSKKIKSWEGDVWSNFRQENKELLLKNPGWQIIIFAVFANLEKQPLETVVKEQGYAKDIKERLNHGLITSLSFQGSAYYEVRQLFDHYFEAASSSSSEVSAVSTEAEEATPSFTARIQNQFSRLGRTLFGDNK